MSQQSAASRMDATVRIPDHVVFRSFAQETVVLNLESGRYHGLNPTAGAMLTALEATGSIRGALQPLSNRFPSAGAQLEQDLLSFCDDAGQRGLIEITE